jgi:hypothetical protein
MTKLPATFEEAEALAYAREGVHMVQAEKVSFMGLRLSWFEKADSRSVWKQWLKLSARDPIALIDLCNEARAGDGLARQALSELILDYRHQHADLPPALAGYEADLIREAGDPEHHAPGIRGRRRSDVLLRDIAIVWIVGTICWKFGLKPTRNPASKREHLCGCGIVARALAAEGMAISEAAVVSLWTRWGRSAFPAETLTRPYPS